MVTYRRIIFILTLFFSQSVYALSISIEKSTPDGVFQKAISLNAKQSILVRNSNYFDKDIQEVGKYEVTNKKSLNADIVELERLSKALDLIAKSVSNPKSLIKPKHETTYLKVDSHYITPDHPMFKEIDTAISKVFDRVKLKEVDVLEIAEKDGFLVKLYRKNKHTKEVNFNVKEICRQEANFLTCNDENYGTIFIK
jgi:hypothetical protein